MKDNVKIALTAMFFGLGLTSHAETLLTNTYEIVSDVKNDSIPEGYCLVQGKVYEPYSNSPISNGYVGETGQKRMAKVNINGTYSIKLLENDSTLFFFHPEYGEIVCWNYDFKSQHIVTINFIVNGETDDVIYEVEKPVIYLYSDKPLEVQLTLKPLGNLSFTYPQYDDGWSVMVENNALTVKGKTYPYLFWEAETDDLNFKGTDKGMEGFFIKTDSTIQFLEGVLTMLGLNITEQTDFITYWGPRLTAHPYATIQFFVDDAYSKYIGDIDVKPKPDTQRRVYMIFKGVNEPMNVDFLMTPKLKPLKRTGFTLIEWGGSEL